MKWVSRHDGHYPLGDAHGLHWHMLFLCTRLPALVEQTTAEYIILMEGDCRFIETLCGTLECWEY